MKAKIAYTLTTTALVMSAFLIGKYTTPVRETIITKVPANYIPMETAIPVEDIAEQYIGTNGYLTVELKDLSCQLDDKANVSYADVLMNIPDTTQEHKANEIDLRDINVIEDNGNYYSIILNDGNEYVIDK